VPVLRDGEILYDISFSPPIEIFQTIIERQRPSRDWTISIFDGNGINFARVPNPQETVGKRASPSLYAEMFRKPEATLQTVSLEGVSLITTYERSLLTGWTVAAGIAESSLVGPLWRNLAITSLIGGVLLLTGLGFAVRMATTIARGEMLHDLLIEELNHRVKNTLAILQSIAAHKPFVAPARPNAKNSRAGSVRWPKRTICSAGRSGKAPNCRTWLIVSCSRICSTMHRGCECSGRRFRCRRELR
jgi:hypothetical protein